MKVETATNAKVHFGQILDSAAKEPVVIQKSGRNVAVVISFEEYERIIALEDSYWVEKADKAKKKGFIGVDAGEQLLSDLLNAKD